MPNSAPAPKRFRTDLEGLRGFAIALVVVFHVFVGRVSSGVDVFLLLGGVFFFSGQLNNALNPRGQTLLQSLMRIIRRLYPHLVAVVAATLVGGLVVLSRLQHQDLANDALASLGYFQNWSLANSGREYSSIQEQVSPFQHLWSMAVQFQVYIGALLFIWLFVLLVRRHPKPIFTTLLAIATGASFAYATWLHFDDQTLNYYSTLSRFWEIGLGGLLGMLIARRQTKLRADGTPKLFMARAPRFLRWLMGIAGIAAILSTGFFLDGAQVFPGAWTLLPLSGAALVFLAGTGVEYESAKTNGKSVGVNRLLETRLFQFFGKISYGLYLWHWPLLVLALNWSGSGQVSPILGASVIAASVLLAWLTLNFIEKPFRQQDKPARSWFKPFASFHPAKAAFATALVAVAAAVACSPLILNNKDQSQSERLWDLASDVELYPGARAFNSDVRVLENVPLVPPLDDFDDLTPDTVRDGCAQGFTEPDLIETQDHNSSDIPCAYGDVDSDQTIYLVGASHSEHYLPALDQVMAARGIKLVPILKMACPLNSNQPMPDGSDNPSCREWSKRAMEFIEDNPPTDGIVMTGTRPTTVLGEGPEVVPDEFVETVEEFSDMGIHSYLIRDNPWFIEDSAEFGPQMNMRRCVAEMVEGSRRSDELGRDFPGVANEDRVTPDEIDRINEVCGNDVQNRVAKVNPATGAPTDPLAWGGDFDDPDATAELPSPDIELQAHSGLPAGATPTGYVDQSGNTYYVDGSGLIYYVAPGGGVFTMDAYGNSTQIGKSEKQPEKPAKQPKEPKQPKQPQRDPDVPALPNNGAYKGLSVTNIDLTASLCGNGWCPGIIGNVVVYRDAHHYTNVFSATLAPELERQMFGRATIE